MDTDLIIIGLGPGGREHLTIGAMEIMKNSANLFFRTAKHPVVDYIMEQGIKFKSFDYLYDQGSDFEQVYSAIADVVIESAANEPVVFAVPGHPMVGENSVEQIIKLAKDKGLSYKIMPSMSFLDPILSCLRLSISDGMKLIDGVKLIGDEIKPDSLPDPNTPNIVMQVYSPLVASEVKISLMKYYPDEHIIKVIRAAGVPELEKIQEVPLYELDRLSWIDHLTSVYLPPVANTFTRVSRFPLDSLVDCMETLRDVDGCPWDKEQTHQTLKKYLIEETYEVLEAIDEGNMYKFCEELGDLLLQVVFHAQIARESGHFDINEVTRAISEKIIRRHPHVYGNIYAKNSQEVIFNWEEIKKEELREKGEIRKSVLDGIPKGLPALAAADKVQRKAAKVGFDWPDYTGAYDKVIEEIEEVKEAVLQGEANLIQGELGDLLFAVVNLARLLKVDSEEALSGAIHKFKSRFSVMEEISSKSQKKLEDMDLTELDRLWEEAKEILILNKKI